MRSRVLAFSVLSAALCGLIVGCGSKSKPTPGKGDGPEAAPEAPVEVGSPLYAAVAPPAYQRPRGADPLVIPNCVAQYEERQVVSFNVEGTIELFATPFKDGEFERLTDEQKREQVVYHPRLAGPDGKRLRLKRIREGMAVEADQVVAYMDDQLVVARMEGALKIKQSAENAKKNADEGVGAAKDKYDRTYKLWKIGGASETDVIDQLITLTRFRENLDQANSQIAKSDADYKEAAVQYDRHKARSGVSGVVRSIPKNPRENVKAGDKIMEIEATERIRLEGQLDAQYRAAVKVGDRVTVEPVLPSAPASEHSRHRQGVNGIAVTAHPDGPLVVSVGADRRALVWDPPLPGKPGGADPVDLPHPVPVRSVVATPPAAKALLVITGGDDGKVRVWDVANRGQLPKTPKAEPDDAHGTAVTALAVSPDGKFLASAAGREVFVWDLTAAKKLYALSAEHRDSVTAVHFTPQNTLVTASKDGTLKVWKLGDKGAAVSLTLDHRAGAVDGLGVSRDGARLLFDQGKGRLDLVDPANGQTVGHLQNPPSAGSFATLAVFGAGEVPAGAKPEDVPYTLVTAGGDGDLKGAVQVWQAPRGGGRGSEVGRLITPGRSPVTCAAFSPVRGQPFMVVGTAAGGVYLWTPPSEARKTYTGRVVNIDASDAKYVTVRVELDNRELQLLDHSIANVIIGAEK